MDRKYIINHIENTGLKKYNIIEALKMIENLYPENYINYHRNICTLHIYFGFIQGIKELNSSSCS